MDFNGQFLVFVVVFSFEIFLDVGKINIVDVKMYVVEFGLVFRIVYVDDGIVVYWVIVFVMYVSIMFRYNDDLDKFLVWDNMDVS